MARARARDYKKPRKGEIVEGNKDGSEEDESEKGRMGSGSRLSQRIGYAGEEDKKRSACAWQKKAAAVTPLIMEGRRSITEASMIGARADLAVGIVKTNGGGISDGTPSAVAGSATTSTSTFVAAAASRRNFGATARLNGGPYHGTKTRQIEVNADQQSALSSIGNFSANNKWRFLSDNGKWDHEAIMITLATYVKQKVFPHLKFIPSQSWVAFDTSRKSICGQVMRHLNIPARLMDEFWKKYGRKVETFIGSKRNDAATALKNAFFSKLVQSVVSVA
jgi:hypothetical protein